jgi:hypothetical protein
VQHVSTVDDDPVEADRSALAIVEPGVIDVGVLTLCRILVNSIPADHTDEVLVINDCATLASARKANQICSLPLGQLQNANIVEVFANCTRGLCVSQIPRGAKIALAYSGGSMNSIYEKRVLN